MFGETIDNHITMLQRVVALTRDLIIAVVAGLTVMVLALGGNPAELNALDFIRLGSAAFLVVVGPAAVFLVTHILYRITLSSLETLGSLLLHTRPLPRGFLAWMTIRLLRRSRRDYIKFIRTIRWFSEYLAVQAPRLFQLMRLFVESLDKYYAFQRRVAPYLYALLALIITVIMFRTILLQYLPP